MTKIVNIIIVHVVTKKLYYYRITSDYKLQIFSIGIPR